MAEVDGPSKPSRKPRSTPTGLAPEPLDVVILGASFGGLSCAHHFLDHAISKLRSTARAPTYRLILISPSTHFYWNIGAPRALVKPGNLFVPIEQGFHRNRGTPFLFIQAEARQLDPTSKTLTIECVTNAERKRISAVLKYRSSTSPDPAKTRPKLDEKGEYPNPKLQTLQYHALICATGSSAHSDLLSLHGPHLTTIGALQTFHSRVAAARTVLICGGGTSGVETAGQLSVFWNYQPAGPLFPFRRQVKKESRKQILLIAANERLLPALKPSAGSKALKLLRSLNVDVRLGVRVEKVEEEFDLTGQTRVGLSDETTMIVDAYIACTGVTPNSSYLPPNPVDAKGNVNCNDKTLRVEVTSHSTSGPAAERNLTIAREVSAATTNDAASAASTTPTTTNNTSAAGPVHPERLYALGDCASYSQNYLLDVYAAVPTVMHNLLSDLLIHELHSAAPYGGNADAIKALRKKDAVYEKRIVGSQLCPVSRFGGVGVLTGLGVPRLVVWGLKGWDYGVGKARRVVCDGGNPYAVTGKYAEF